MALSVQTHRKQARLNKLCDFLGDFAVHLPPACFGAEGMVSAWLVLP